MAARDPNLAHDKPQTKEPVVVDYASASVSVDPDLTLRNSTLLWFTTPAIAAAALMAESLREIEAAPDDPTAGTVVTSFFIVVMLISGVTSGAVALSVFEARKTIASVSILAINLIWLAICSGWFLMRIIG